MYLTKKEIAEKMGIGGTNLEIIVSEMSKTVNKFSFSGRDNLGILKFDYDKIVKFIRTKGKDCSRRRIR